MTSEQAQSILRRMMGQARTQSRGPSVTRSLRLALERSAKEMLGLTLEVTSLRQSQCRLDELAKRLPGGSMIAVLEGEAQGATAIDTALLSGLVEFQTIGRVLPVVDSERVATRVDAALVAPFLDITLSKFEEEIAQSSAEHWANGYVFGAMVADARTLCLTLNSASFHLFEVDVSLCDGARVGTMVLAFAERDLAAREDGDGPFGSEGGDALRKSVLLAPATFSAVIGRHSVPLHDLQSLAVGGKLDLPEGALRETRLEAVGGEHVIPVTLGQLNGFRAVRLRTGERAAPDDSAEKPEPSASGQGGQHRQAAAANPPPSEQEATAETPLGDLGEDLDAFLNEDAASTDLEPA